MDASRAEALAERQYRRDSFAVLDAAGIALGCAVGSILLPAALGRSRSRRAVRRNTPARGNAIGRTSPRGRRRRWARPHVCGTSAYPIDWRRDSRPYEGAALPGRSRASFVDPTCERCMRVMPIGAVTYANVASTSALYFKFDDAGEIVDVWTGE